MGEKNNKVKVKLTTVIVFIIVVVLIIIGIVATILDKDNDSKDNTNVVENKITQVEDEKTDIGLDNKDNEFAFRFLKMENKKQNVVYSPLSIKYALKMLQEGADGNTKTQIENVIGNTNLVKYDNIKDVLSLANALYIRDSYSNNVKDEYKNGLVSRYDAEIIYDAFKDAKNINSWIENKTFGQIKNMLQDNVVQNENNEMFLINVLAIDMAWEDKFDGEDTNAGTFYLDNGDTMEATLMNKETKSDSISYYKDNNVTTLVMDLEQYNNEEMQFIAIMPKDNLSDYVNNFSAENLENIVDNLTLASETKYGVDISIPRFSFDYNLNLKDDLVNLGITDAFDKNLADFSNMSNLPLFVSDALHKANIDFTEKGIRAAAVTVIMMTDEALLANENEPIEIKIDKPFMYVIKDKKTGEIWFTGTVYEPNSWEDDRANFEYR